MTEERQDHTEEEVKQAPDFNQRAYHWIERHPLPALLMAASVLVILVWVFWPVSAPEWMGFVYTVPIPGQELYRTGWDWLGLLIVPLAVAVGAAYISYVQKRTELDIAKKAREEDRKIAQQARESEQQIANDRLRQATLESYYDRMTELLLKHQLRESTADSEVCSIARARTIAVVRNLDGERNRQLLAFLNESKLIERGSPIIDLSRADYSKVDLSGTDLSGADLSEADLSGANLSKAELRGVNLSGAKLLEADLRCANLSEANMRWVTISDADLTYTHLGKADLFMADLFGSDLSYANLRGANLRQAELHTASLSHAVLGEADLTGANVSDAIMRHVSFDNADLTDLVDWTVEQFDQVGTMTGAVMPNGVRLGGDNREGPTYEIWKAQYLYK